MSGGGGRNVTSMLYTGTPQVLMGRPDSAGYPRFTDSPIIHRDSPMESGGTRLHEVDSVGLRPAPAAESGGGSGTGSGPPPRGRTPVADEPPRRRLLSETPSAGRVCAGRGRLEAARSGPGLR